MQRGAGRGRLCSVWAAGVLPLRVVAALSPAPAAIGHERGRLAPTVPPRRCARGRPHARPTRAYGATMALQRQWR